MRRKSVGTASPRGIPMTQRWRIVALIAIIVAIAPTRSEAVDAPCTLPATTLTAPNVAIVQVPAAVGAVPAAPAASNLDALFQIGSTSTQTLSGLYPSGVWGPRSRQFNYVPLSIRQGVMLSTPENHWWGPGNYESLLDLTGSSITTTYGNWFAGATLFGRANLLEAGSSIVPYLQAGVGVLYSDTSTDQSQHALGLPFEFYLHLEAGLKFYVAPNLSLDIEGGLQHISNGGLGKRNYGINCYGGTVGFTYHLPNGS